MKFKSAHPNPRHNTGTGKSILFLILKIIVALIIFCTSPILPVYTLILLTARQCVYFCSKIFRPDLNGFLKTASVLLAQEDIWTKPKYNLVTVHAFDGPIQLEELRTLFQQQVLFKTDLNGELVYPQLQQYWTSFMNYLFWKQDDCFDLKNHIRMYDYTDFSDSDNENDNRERNLSLLLPRAEDGTCNENGIREIMAGLIAKRWKRYQSCWEMLVISNFRSVEHLKTTSMSKSGSGSKCGTLLIFRLHHGMCDGYSLLKLLMRDMFKVEPNIQINVPKMTMSEKLQLTLLLPFKLPWHLAALIVDSFDGPNCWHFLNQELSREYFVNISKPIDVDLIKRIKNKYGVSYQAVLCTAVASGCQRVMEDAGQEVPSQITCLTPIPLENHPDGLVNHLTAMYMKWPLRNCSSSEERLRLISESIINSRSYIGQLGFRFLTKLTCLSPNFISQNGCKVPCTIILSNFPGPELNAPKRLLGTNYTDIIAGAGCGPGQVGATMMLVSTNGKQRCVTSIDKSVFPSQQLLRNLDKYIEEELFVLLASDVMIPEA